MDVRIIKSPTDSTLDIVFRRLGSSAEISKEDISAIGLVQGKMIDMIVCADIAEKSSGVFASELRGSCPQNMLALAILGDTSSVEAAIEKIKSLEKEGKR